MSNSDDNGDSYLVEDTLDDSSVQDDSLFGNSLEGSDNEDEEKDVFFDYNDADNQHKQPYEVDYMVHSPGDLQKSEEEHINQVRSVLGLSDQEAAILLRYFQWNKEKLFERYMDDPTKVQKAAGITNENTDRRQTTASIVPAKRARSDFVCEICYDDNPDMETAALSCGHRFCTSCYRQYLTQKIQDEGESRLIQCPESQCKVLVDEKTVLNLVDKPSQSKYFRLLGRAFVDDNDSLRWCPAPDCEYAVECHIPSTSLLSIIPTVECNCGHRFCFACGIADHQPCVCALVKKWLQKCRDDSETANWISVHTKDCPKCQSAIEKNGGCNHMTCRNCRYEFCWVCMGPWSEHRSSFYACNRYAENNAAHAKNQAMSRASLERYLHYYNRYANHEQSAKLDEELYHETEEKMEEMQKSSDLSWIEVQFLKKAVDIAVQCRMTLKWTYAFAFYLKRNHQTEIFEDNQRDLELATEQLSELLEAPLDRENITNLRQAILDKSVYVKQRRNILLDDALKVLQEGRWNFTVDLD